MNIKTIIRNLLPIRSVKSLLQTQPFEDPVVDGLRGLSAVMVVVFHTLFAVYFLFKSRPELFQNYLESYAVPFRFLFGFDKAVDIFFMISAYLLGKSLLTQSRRSKLQVRTFYINRLFRIYPLFIIALVLYSLGSWHLFERDFWFNLIFIDNFLHNTIVPVGWSLSVEMQCYLVLPLVIWCAEKSKSPILFFVVLLLLTVLARAAMAFSTPEVYQLPFHVIFMNPDQDYQYMDVMYYATPSRVSSFVVGLLWAALVLDPTFKSRLAELSRGHSMKYLLVGVSSLVLICSLYFPIYDASLWLRWSWLEANNFVLVVFHRVVFSTALLVLILVLHQPSGLFYRFLSLPILRVFSKLAFPVYLFHFPAIAIAWLMVLQTTDLKSIVMVTPLQTGLAAVIALFIVVWVSLPLHFLIEQKGIRIGRRLTHKR